MIWINIMGFLLIALIIWWFWLYRPKDVAAGEGNLLITVADGVYQPASIALQENTPVTLRVLRKDPSPCSETLLIPELDISVTLPLDKPIEIEIPPLKNGNYPFNCQMQMYRGELKVR